jgi:argininosuccinate lyase
MPQRRAHHLVGAIVGEAMERKVPLAELPLEVMRVHAEEIDESVYECLGTANAVAAFVSYGSTAPDQVRAQIESWKERLN